MVSNHVKRGNSCSGFLHPFLFLRRDMHWMTSESSPRLPSYSQKLVPSCNIYIYVNTLNYCILSIRGFCDVDLRSLQNVRCKSPSDCHKLSS